MATHKEVVVLVHGLWFSGWSLRLLQWRLARAGFDARVFAYPSVSSSLSQAADALQQYARAIDASTVHFVGHSLGGLVIRALFHAYPQQRSGRIVTLGTPHGGSVVARRLLRWRPARRLLGRGIGDMVRGAPDAWLPPANPVGVIAGDYSVGLGRLVARLPQPNDGTVSLAESRWDRASSFLVLRVSHFGMLFMPVVARHVACFLRSGRLCR